MKTIQKIVMDPFCYRQFEEKAFSRINFNKEEFALKINEF